MYQVFEGHTNLQDAQDFIDLLNKLDQHQDPKVSGLFDSQHELVVTRAPGRLDVMGGIADYSGSLVLELPIREATFVALQQDPDPHLRIVSLSEDNTQETTFEMPLSDFVSAGGPVDYAVARAHFQRNPQQHWVSYVAGVFLVLMRELHVKFSLGARILISSSVPLGKGVSSSAALEVAVMQAVTVAFGIELKPQEVALLCQRVENLVVGAPCGIMDQMTSVCGEASRLLALLCQPAEVQGAIELPDNVVFWGIDSGIRHSVGGSDYGAVRIGAFMGYRIIADLAGLNIIESAPGVPCQVDDPKWGGYLANMSPAEFEKDYAYQLPERISGADFLRRYRSTTDQVTRVDPQGTFAVRVPTSHPIYEHQRVRQFVELLCEEGTRSLRKTTQSEERGIKTPAATHERLRMLGELMYQSNESYSACGLNSEGTDLLVELVREAGPATGLYGAKITGGGSGGTVAVLTTRGAAPGIKMICERYAQQTSNQPYIFLGSSPGSDAFGHLVVRAIG